MATVWIYGGHVWFQWVVCVYFLSIVLVLVSSGLFSVLFGVFCSFRVMVVGEGFCFVSPVSVVYSFSLWLLLGFFFWVLTDILYGNCWIYGVLSGFTG